MECSPIQSEFAQCCKQKQENTTNDEVVIYNEEEKIESEISLGLLAELTNSNSNLLSLYFPFKMEKSDSAAALLKLSRTAVFMMKEMYLYNCTLHSIGAIQKALKSISNYNQLTTLCIDFIPSINLSNSFVAKICSVGCKVEKFFRITGCIITGYQMSTIFDSFIHVPTLVLCKCSLIDLHKFKVNEKYLKDTRRRLSEKFYLHLISTNCKTEDFKFLVQTLSSINNDRIGVNLCFPVTDSNFYCEKNDEVIKRNLINSYGLDKK